MEKKRELIWDEKALTSLEKSLKRISESSIKQAEQVEQAVLAGLEIIRTHSERYPPDKYKKNNTGNYRAFETHSFRVSYYSTAQEIWILRFRHVKQKPEEY